MKKNYFYYIVFFILAIISCGDDPPPPPLRTVHNFIVVLDLSSRLYNPKTNLDNIKQEDNDKEKVLGIYDQFYNTVKNKLFIRSKDKFKIIVLKQDGNKDYSDFEDSTAIDLSNLNILNKKKVVENSKKRVKIALDKLYSDKRVYNGADVVSYFNNKLEGDILQNDTTQNFIFVITDGKAVVNGVYNSLWEVPVDKSFRNTNVMLLEMVDESKGNNSYFDNKKCEWITWLEKMKIKNISIQLQNTQNDVIKGFVELNSDYFTHKPANCIGEIKKKQLRNTVKKVEIDKELLNQFIKKPSEEIKITIIKNIPNNIYVLLKDKKQISLNEFLRRAMKKEFEKNEVVHLCNNGNHISCIQID